MLCEFNSIQKILKLENNIFKTKKNKILIIKYKFKKTNNNFNVVVVDVAFKRSYLICNLK